MTNDEAVEDYPFAQEGGRRFGWIAAALALALAIAAGGWGWTVQRRAAVAEQALAGAAADREAAVSAAKQWQDLLNQAETAAQATDARVAELEQRVQSLDELLQTANMEVSRLESELAARTAADVGGEESGVAPAIVTGEAAPAEGNLGTAEPPAVAAVEPAAAPAAPEPAAGPAPAPRNLAIVFDVNSSYLPTSLDGRLAELAADLEAGRGYQVELVGSVGNGDVEGKSAEEALRYNRWMAERRMTRVAEFLQKNSKADQLTFRQDFALNDPSRQVLVEVLPAQP